MFLKEKFVVYEKFDKLKAPAGQKAGQKRLLWLRDVITHCIHNLTVPVIAAKEKSKVVTIDFSVAYLNAQSKNKVLTEIEKFLSLVVVTLDPSKRECIFVDDLFVTCHNTAILDSTAIQ